MIFYRLHAYDKEKYSRQWHDKDKYASHVSNQLFANSLFPWITITIETYYRETGATYLKLGNNNGERTEDDYKSLKQRN